MDNINILYIEDDEGISLLAKESLENYGWNITMIRTFGEAIVYLKTNRPYLMVIDYSLPDMNASQFLDALKSNSVPIPPFVVTTGMGNEKIAVNMMKKGARDYIIKTSTFIDVMAVEVKKTIDQLLVEDKLKQSEMNLVEKERHLAEAQKIAHLGSWRRDFEKNTLTSSDEINRIFGLPLDVNMTVDILMKMMHPDDVSAFIDSEAEAVRNKDSINFVYRIITLDGQTKYLHRRALVFFNEQGKVSYIEGTILDITEQKMTEEKLKHTIEQKEILLHELFHRTKNNMQVIIAMMRLQSRYFDDEKIIDAYKETENRIQSMALVHQKLYQTQDLSSINILDYINSFCYILMDNYDIDRNKIQLNIAGDRNLLISIEVAIPFGIVVNEIVSNTFKYAFPNGREGKLSININTKDNGILLEISDNGVGIDKDLNIREPETYGLKLIFDLIELQLNGKVDFSIDNGTCWKIFFSDNIIHKECVFN